MRNAIRRGFSFGLTSGVITTLGLIVGLYSGTRSSLVVVGGILIIAISDALSDALGIHISVESENKYTIKEIWSSTISTFLSKFVIALTFIISILLFELSTAIVVNVIWGLFLITAFNYYIAKRQRRNPSKIIFEHLIIAILVIIITYYVGNWVKIIFG